MANEFFAYYRVSTNRQGESGLGLDAQRQVTSDFLHREGGKMLGEFTEVESGRRSDRPMLNEAIEACKKSGATLLIAKLDRLARNVHFISGLLEANVRFIAIDMPNADRFMLHVYAAIAEEEARKISERTKAALAVAKARGVKLGKHGVVRGAERKREADEFARRVGPKIRNLRVVRGLTFQEIAEALNNEGIECSGGGKWYTTSVHRVNNRFKQLEYSNTPIGAANEINVC